MRPPRSDYRYCLNRHNMQFAIESALARGDGVTALAVSGQYRDEYLAGEVDAASRLLGSATYYARGLHGDVARGARAPSPTMSSTRRCIIMRAARRWRGAATRRRCAPRRRRSRRCAPAPRAPALGGAARQLAEIFQRVLEGRAAMLAGDHRAAKAAYRAAMNRQLAADFGFDPPLFWYSVRRSLAAAELAGGDASERPRRSCAPRCGAGPTIRSRSTPCRWPSARSAAAPRPTRSLARARAGWAGDVTEVPLSRI